MNNATTTPDPALILVYGATWDDRRLIFMKEGGSYLNYTLRLISDEEIQKTIGELVESVEPATITRNPDAPSLLLFHGMDQTVMRQLLGALRDNAMHFDLKAVVTETNRTWPLAALLGELSEEHALMQAWHALASITQRCDLLLMEPIVLQDEGGFELAVEETKAYLRERNVELFTLDTLSEKRKNLEAHLKRLGY